MTHVLIGVAAAVVVFLVCAGLHWLPARAIGKALLLAYLVAVGVWAGLSWSQFSTEAKIVSARLSPKRFRAEMNRIWPGPRPEKVTAREIGAILGKVTEEAVAGSPLADEVEGLVRAGQEMVGQRKAIDTQGYAKTSEIEVFITDILPYRFRDRILARFPDRKARLFGYSCLLALLGVAVGAITSGTWRKTRAEKPIDIS